MPRLLFYRLRVVIPAVVCLVTLCIVGYQTYDRLSDDRAFFFDNTRQTLAFKMNELQSLLSDMMLQGDRERAQQTLANAALDRQIVAILLTDDNNRVLFASRREWLAAPAQDVTRYDAARADRVRSDRSSKLASLPGQFAGYYPVALSMERGELRPQRFGVLYVEYDYSRPLARAQRETYRDAAKLLCVSLALSLALSFGLHFLVTKRIERLLSAMKDASSGNLEARAGMQGHGEIGLLAKAFDEMVAELARKQQDLQEQAVELEQEVAERQTAQEGLEEQAVLLEEEIVERIRVEESLKETSLFNQQIIDGAREGIVVYDRSLRYRVWNRFMEELSGMPAAEIIGKHPLQVFPFLKDTGVMENLQRVLEGGKGTDQEYPFQIVHNGRSGWASHSSCPMLDPKGELIGVMAMIHDITQQKQVEEQLRQSQKMEAVGQLAGGIAHDFNNILTVIIGCGEMLRADPSLGPRHADHTNQILAAAERAAQLTRGLLSFSRKQVMAPRVLDLNEVVRQAQKFLARVVGEDMQLKTICNHALLKVKVDAGQMEQVLINLVTNARDAMPNGGLLCIETDRERLAPAEGGYADHAGAYAVIAVSDTGHGMDRETCQKVFEPFFTTKEAGKGTGLGMSIVHGIVSQHGGFVKVRSEPGKGTCFKIYLPLLPDAPEAGDEAQSLLPPPKRGSETVLVAEDDAEIRGLFAAVLSGHGYRVLVAENGEQAVQIFAAHRERIKLNILDVIMPKMNGVEANEEIRKLQPAGVRTLFSTGYTKDLLQKRGELTAWEDVIMKPVRPQELLRTVRAMLDRE